MFARQMPVSRRITAPTAIVYIAYVRVSTHGQLFGRSLPRQREQISNFIQATHGRLLATYSEVGSEWRDGCPERTRAIRRALRGGATLVVSSIDRFTRSVDTLDKAVESGLRIRSLVKRESSQEDHRNAVLWARSVMHERNNAAKEGRWRARKEGVKFGDPTRGASRRRRAQEFAKGAMTEILKLKAEGVSKFGELASQLNARGYSAPRGGVWHPETVRRTIERMNSKPTD